MRFSPENGQSTEGEKGIDGLTAAFWEHALVVARARARHYRLWWEDGEDTAMDFLSHVLQNRNTFLRHHLQGAELEAWLFRCADNWAIKAYWRQKRRRNGEILLSELKLGERDPLLGSIPAREPPPESLVIRKELRQRVHQAMLLLPPSQQALYVAFYVEQRSIPELARSSHRTVGSICGALRLLRSRMLVQMKRASLGEAEIREYQQLISTW